MKIFKPTLTRRVMLAVVLAIGLIWIVLMIFEYNVNRWIESHHNPALTELNQQIIDAISTIDNSNSAAIVAAGINAANTNSRARAGVHGGLIFKLLDSEHYTVYQTPGTDAALLVPSVSGEQHQITINGTIYYAATLVTNKWTIVSAQARLDSIWLLKEISSEITLDVLLSLPVALLPVWLAVSTGLRPLRRISERISKRSANDLSPIGVSAKYLEIKPLITELDDLLLKLKSTIHRERAFVHDAAHELRTPMAVISVQAHALAQAKTDGDRTEAEFALNSALKRASHLVHQLLLLARLDNPITSDSTEIDVAQLLRHDLAAFASAASEKHIELNLDAPDKLMLNIAVPAFQSVVNNLVDNAIRYGRHNGHITVTLQHDEITTSLSVVDDGPGIPESDLDRVFERFYRGSGHDVSGTGLGLAIVKQATTLLGGSIQLTSRSEGTGCCFTLRIPH
jgi:two-component system sensor histidine kinase QseC